MDLHREIQIVLVLDCPHNTMLSFLNPPERLEAAMKRKKVSKEIKIDRPPRVEVTREEALKRMKQFSQRKEQFLATARAGKNRNLHT